MPIPFSTTFGTLPIEKSKSQSIITVKERILRIMANLVPQFDRWKTQRQFDDSINFSIFEKGIEKPLIPNMVSDGTVRLLSLLLALLYRTEHSPLICIDEPERYLHPQVLEEIVVRWPPSLGQDRGYIKSGSRYPQGVWY